MKNYEFWFVVGSQFLYGPEVLETVEARAREMAQELSLSLPFPLDQADFAFQLIHQLHPVFACSGRVNAKKPLVVLGSVLSLLGRFRSQKTYLRLPEERLFCHGKEAIDMDFMNLNQAAHGDREHGFIGARLRKPRKIIAGFWKEASVRSRLGAWMRTAVGVAVSREMRVMRFGDNMRDVAVTEGDKVEAQKKLGWQVHNTVNTITRYSFKIIFSVLFIFIRFNRIFFIYFFYHIISFYFMYK